MEGARLIEVLGLEPGDVVAVAGAGGKTTLVQALADQGRERGWRVVITTTTHMGALSGATPGPVVVAEDGDPMPRLRAALEREGRVWLLGRRVRPDKLAGIAPATVDALRGLADLVLVEADGARGRSLKMPAAHEPVVPGSSSRLVVVAALDVLGAPLSAGRVHREALLAAATGRTPGSPVDETLLVTALAEPSGYPERCPASARLVAFLNKVETAALEEAADRIALRLRPPYSVTVAGSARTGRGRACP